MTHERTPGSGRETHPADQLFEKLGLPEGYGESVISYHGRSIQVRDYFSQPDVNPMARQVFNALSAMDESHPDFPRYRDAFFAAAQQFTAES